MTAAEQGDREAQERTGDIYNTGDGSPLDKQAAMKWYRRAAERAPPRQTLERKLAALYLQQKTYKGYRAAIRHLLRAGGPDSYIELARLFLEGGPDVPPNYARAFTFAHAAEAWAGLMKQAEWDEARAIQAEAAKHLSDKEQAMAADYSLLWTTTAPPGE